MIVEVSKILLFASFLKFFFVNHSGVFRRINIILVICMSNKSVGGQKNLKIISVSLWQVEMLEYRYMYIGKTYIGTFVFGKPDLENSC